MIEFIALMLIMIGLAWGGLALAFIAICAAVLWVGFVWIYAFLPLIIFIVFVYGLYCLVR